MDEAHEDPQGGMSAHLFNLEADGAATPDQPAEGGEYDAPADGLSRRRSFRRGNRQIGTEAPAEATSVGEQAPAETTTADESPVGTAAADEALAGQTPVGDEGAALLGETAAAPDVGRPRYEGEGVYVGREPPEGFTIKGNERSMKYHVPESAGYGRTVAEVWFNSEEAAQSRLHPRPALTHRRSRTETAMRQARTFGSDQLSRQNQATFRRALTSGPFAKPSSDRRLRRRGRLLWRRAPREMGLAISGWMPGHFEPSCAS